MPFLAKLVSSMIKAECLESVVEMGVGHYSTPLLMQLTEVQPEKARIYSIENDAAWVNKIQDSMPRSDRHIWDVVSEQDSWLSSLNRIVLNAPVLASGFKFDLAFIDSSPWESRSLGALMLRDLSRVVVIHDADYFPMNGSWGSSFEPIRAIWSADARGWVFGPSSIGYRNYDDLFGNWIEVFPMVGGGPTGPPTLIGSMTIDVREYLLPELNQWVHNSSMLTT